MTTFINPPKNCDVCGQKLTSVMYDARTHSGPWGCLCPTCYRVHGVGLGTGKGQKYERQDGKYVKVAG